MVPSDGQTRDPGSETPAGRDERRAETLVRCGAVTGVSDGWRG